MAESGETTIIGSDTVIVGEMRSEKHAKIVGRFEGKVYAKGELHVAGSAMCKADVEAATVTVDGGIEGDVNASQKVTLNAQAKIKGDITTDKMAVAEGASFFGMCAVGPDAAKMKTGSSQGGSSSGQSSSGGQSSGGQSSSSGGGSGGGDQGKK